MTTESKRVRMVCEECGSREVVGDAHAHWNETTQAWEVYGIFDKGAHCDACDAETKIKSVPLNDHRTGNDDVQSYAVRMQIHIGEYEKGTTVVVDAESADAAARLALENECHFEPGLSVDGWACEDGDVFRYTVRGVQALTTETAAALRQAMDGLPRP